MLAFLLVLFSNRRKATSRRHPAPVMGVKEPNAAQTELFDYCKRGETERVRGWLGAKRNRRPRTPLNFLRPSTPGSGWISSMRDPTSGYTALHLAALHGHQEICRLLMDADPHTTTAKDRRGCIPVHLAAWNGHDTVAKLLTDFEPESVDVVNNVGEAALHLASQHGHVKVVGILLDNHSDARLRNARSETPLDIAVRYGHYIVVKILLHYCPELSLQSAAECSTPVKHGEKNRVTYPFHIAARGSHVKCMELLRRAGFDLDYVTDEGSALHVAALHGQVEAVRFLLKEGINPHIRDSKGRTVIDALEEHENERSTDLTQVMAVREEWKECKAMIEEYISTVAAEKMTLTSSSDSGIDRKDSSGERRDTNSSEDRIWRPLPSTASGFSSTRTPPDVYTRPVKGRKYSNNNDGNPTMTLSTVIDCAGTYSGRSTVHAGTLSVPQSNTINRTWNSRIMADAETGRLVPRFPLTSPNTKMRHQNSKRVSDTLPVKMGIQRTATAPSRASILPGDGCVYRAPPSYESYQQPERRQGSQSPRLPPNGYDNAPSTSRMWEHVCAHPSNGGGSIGHHGRSPLATTSMLPTRSDGTQTLPTGANRPMTRVRPSVMTTFRDIDEEASVPPPPPIRTKSRQIINREDSIGLGSSSPVLTTRASSRSSNTFNCSTLERSMSPMTAVRRLEGNAPLAMPEEMTGSTTNSYIASSVSPDRYQSNTGTLESPHRRRFPISISGTFTETGEMPTKPTSLEVHHCSASSSHNVPLDPPSPNSSEAQIFELLSAAGSLVKSPSTRNAAAPLNNSPTATECSDTTVASSCSLPLISQTSITPPSVASPRKELNPLEASVRLRNGGIIRTIEEADDSPLDESAEWRKIESLMQSYGGGICRESRQFNKEYAPQVAYYLRDRHSKALTLQLNSPMRKQEELRVPDIAEKQTAELERWLKQDVGLDSVDSATMALLLQRNGFDRIEHMHASLDRLALIEMGVNDHLQRTLCTYLDSTPMRTKYTSANDLNYVSEWLQMLDLHDYLGCFFKSGLKTMLIVRASEIDQAKLHEIGIPKLGHVLRILFSLRQAKKQALVLRTADKPRISSPPRNRRLSVAEQLVAGWVQFSAHYLGSTEISNVNSTEEAKAAMARLKKAIREIAKVPQIRLEVSISGVRISDAISGRQTAFHEISHIQVVCQDERDLNCFTYIASDSDRFLCHVFCVLTADVATEIVVTLGQAFEVAYQMQQTHQEGATRHPSPDPADRPLPSGASIIEC